MLVNWIVITRMSWLLVQWYAYVKTYVIEVDTSRTPEVGKTGLLFFSFFFLQRINDEEWRQPVRDL
jgi:hypothetical protein